MAKLRSIGVFCGSRMGERKSYADAAAAVGRAIARAECRLVYGGGDVGLMGIAASSAAAEGGPVYGIIPGFLIAREGHLDDVEIKIVDGVDYMKTGEESFDLIIIDSSDPVGPSAVLFTREFYQSCHDRLAEGGILVTQSGLAAIHSDVVEDTSKSFKAIFQHHGFYGITVPTFSGGVMTLGFATDLEANIAPDEGVIEARFEALSIDTQYYTPAVHRGAFALPRYLDRLIQR